MLAAASISVVYSGVRVVAICSDPADVRLRETILETPPESLPTFGNKHNHPLLFFFFYVLLLFPIALEEVLNLHCNMLLILHHVGEKNDKQYIYILPHYHNPVMV